MGENVGEVGFVMELPEFLSERRALLMGELFNTREQLEKIQDTKSILEKNIIALQSRLLGIAEIEDFMNQTDDMKKQRQAEEAKHDAGEAAKQKSDKEAEQKSVDEILQDPGEVRKRELEEGKKP